MRIRHYLLSYLLPVALPAAAARDRAESPA